MGARRWALVVGALVVAALAVGGGFLLAEPPRTDLPLPAGQHREHVRGNCSSGNELTGCTSGEGPRSFLTVRTDGDPRKAFDALVTSLTSSGWSEDDNGRTAKDWSEGGAAEDLQPVYCKQGCVALFRNVSEGYVLAWFP